MIVVINGSPNKSKNSGYISDYALERLDKVGMEAKKIDIIDILKDLEFPFCTACATPCPQICENKSKKLKEAFNTIRESQGMILVSPVYFGACTGELKAFWDLMRHLRNEKVLYNKIGAAVAVGASKFGGQETTIKNLQDMMMIQGMILIGDGYGDNIGHQGACFIKPANEDENGKNGLDRICNRLVEVIGLFKEKK